MKRKFLSLKERIEVLNLRRSGKSTRKIAQTLSISKTQVLNTLKKEETVKCEWESGAQSQRKIVKERRCAFQQVNQNTYEWFLKARSKNIPISGVLLKEKAMCIAREYGDTSFQASNGWLFKFQKRNNISSRLLHGEANNVPNSVIVDWEDRLRTIIGDYALCDVFNADETALFYRILPNRSLVVKGQECNGGKQSKERLTLLLCCSASGEKLTPLIIGRSEKPRCFKNQNERKRVLYKSNKNAWMTANIFENWLKILNNKFIMNNRRILLIIDNCSAHPDIRLSNIKLAFLPPNSTSRLQPLDAGIIHAVKVAYRRNFLQHISNIISDVTVISDVVKQVTITDAINWLCMSWYSLSSQTITNCFAVCGIAAECACLESSSTAGVDLPSSLSSLMVDGQTIEEYADLGLLVMLYGKMPHLDNDYPCIDIGNENNEADLDGKLDEEDDKTTPNQSVNPPWTIVDAINIVSQLRQFACSEHIELLSIVTELQYKLAEIRRETYQKQSKITDFFRK